MSGPDLDRLSPEGAALFSWFSRLPCFEQREGEMTLDSLSDGYLMWRTLQDTHPDSFSGDLPEGPQASRRWVNNLQNLKRIYKGLRKLIIEDLSLIVPTGLEDIDVKAIAEGSDDEETIKLLKWILNACVNSELNMAYVLTMTELPKAQQPFLMDAVNSFKRKTESLNSTDVSGPANTQAVVTRIDTELYNEEMYGNLAAENRSLQTDKKDLKAEVRDLTSRLSHLQESHSSLIDELRKVQDQNVKSPTHASHSMRMQELEQRIQEQEDHIAEQEAVLAEQMAKESSLSTENNKLRKTNERLQPLQDQIDELKHERDTLVRKNNAMERYKIKVQNAQDIENENKDLRRELEDSKHLSKEGDDARQQNINLQRQLRELQSLVGNTEVQVMEAQTRRKQVELDNAGLRQQIDDVKRKREQDRETLSNLEARLDLSTSNTTGLDIELQESEGRAIETRASRVQVSDTSDPQNSIARVQALQKLLEKEQGKYSDLERRFFDVYKQRLSLEEIVKQPGSIEDDTLHRFTKDEPKNAKPQAYEDDSERASTHREYTEAGKTRKLEVSLRKSCAGLDNYPGSILDKDKPEASETPKELKCSQDDGQSARAATLENQVKSLKRQLYEHRTMLSQMVLAKEQQSDVAESSEQRKAQLDERERQFKASMEEMSQQREKLAKAEKQAQDQDQEILSLRVRLQQALDKTAPEVLKASAQSALQQELQNIKRENKLMSTAYFDLSSRLQVNNVSLQRRTGAPRSFLNKQRALVNQATAVRSR
ncbi:MAG: hypothetical protein MMC23_009603 [Stictis urceolatum]|nr:hypothetical protein [Stictis urceolata]